MSHLFRLARFALLPLAIALSTAGCHKDPALAQADNNQAGAQEQGSDPAAANLPPFQTTQARRLRIQLPASSNAS